MTASDVHDLRLPNTEESPAHARRAVVQWLAGSVPEDRLQNLKLLVSELVTNGVRHAPGGELRLTVRREADTIRVEVSDAGGRFTTAAPPVEPPADAVGGRGLLIVDRIAARWGTSHNGRNTVWFEL